MPEGDATATAATAAAPTTTPAPAATAPPAAAAPSAFDWKTTGLEADALNFVTERGWKSPGDLLTSYRHAETAIGAPPDRIIKLPAPRDAGDAKVWEPIWDKLGRPASPDKYVIPLPEGDKGEFANAVKPVLHKIGLTGSQATELATWWNGKQAEAQKAQATEIETRNTAEVSQLKQAWGTDYDARASLVDRAAETFGMKQDQLDALKVVMGPKGAMEFLYNIGSKIAVEDRTVPGMSNQSTAIGMTPEAAAAKITELRANKDFAKQFNSSDPKQRMEARNEMSRLHHLAYPGMTAVPGSVARKS